MFSTLIYNTTRYNTMAMAIEMIYAQELIDLA